MHEIIKSKLPQLTNLFQKYKVKKVYAFGSVCTPDFTDKSDVDFMISFEEGLDPLIQGENWWSLYYDLQNLIGREIDLVSEHTVKNPYLVKVVNRTKTPIYG
jgi:uncharacterized protein